MENVFGMLLLDTFRSDSGWNEEGGGFTSLETILSFETLSLTLRRRLESLDTTSLL